jgi:hypothetical protein
MAEESVITLIEAMNVWRVTDLLYIHHLGVIVIHVCGDLGYYNPQSAYLVVPVLANIGHRKNSPVRAGKKYINVKSSYCCIGPNVNYYYCYYTPYPAPVPYPLVGVIRPYPALTTYYLLLNLLNRSLEIHWRGSRRSARARAALMW